MPTDMSALTLRSQLSRIIAGRPISVVGNAASLLSSGFGAQIDEGCVVRMNCGVPIRPVAQGRRVDVHCFSTRPSLLHNMRRASWRVRLKRDYFDGAYSVWMSDADREACEDPQQAFYPISLSHVLTEVLGARPSVGARTLHMLAELTDADVQVFGFDFKESPSFYRTRENRGPHDWEAERRFALSVVEQRGWTIVA